MQPQDRPPPSLDILRIIAREEPTLKAIAGRRICIVGGSGFIGTWLSNTLLEANSRYHLNLSINIVARNQKKLEDRLLPGHLGKFRFIKTDFATQNTVIPQNDICFLAATPSSVPPGKNYDRVAASVTENSTRAILESLNLGSECAIIHLSSGSVYGHQAMDLKFMPEIDVDATNRSLSAYGKAKLKTENLLTEKAIASGGNLRVSNPRLFAFAGPLLPLNAHFAVGNFLQDLLYKRDIQVNGSPYTIRSYLYPTDLISALIRIGAQPFSGPINIGSEESITIGDLGSLFTQLSSSSKVHFIEPNSSPTNYVPEVKNLVQEFGWTQEVSLDDAINRWRNWATQLS